MLAIPPQGRRQTGGQRGAWLPAQIGPRPRDVEDAACLAVGPRRVPDDLAPEPADFLEGVHHAADACLLSRGEVDQFRPVVDSPRPAGCPRRRPRQTRSRASASPSPRPPGDPASLRRPRRTCESGPARRGHFRGRSCRMAHRCCPESSRPPAGGAGPSRRSTGRATSVLAREYGALSACGKPSQKLVSRSGSGPCSG